MRLYVKLVGASITFVDVENKVKFNVSPNTAEKLLGVSVKEGEIWEINVARREDLERAFQDFQNIQGL